MITWQFIGLLILAYINAVMMFYNFRYAVYKYRMRKRIEKIAKLKLEYTLEGR